MAAIEGMACMTARGKGFFDLVDLRRGEEELRAGRHSGEHLPQKRIGFRNQKHAPCLVREGK